MGGEDKVEGKRVERRVGGRAGEEILCRWRSGGVRGLGARPFRALGLIIQLEIGFRV